MSRQGRDTRNIKIGSLGERAFFRVERIRSFVDPDQLNRETLNIAKIGDIPDLRRQEKFVKGTRLGQNRSRLKHAEVEICYSHRIASPVF